MSFGQSDCVGMVRKAFDFFDFYRAFIQLFEGAFNTGYFIF